MPSRRQIREAAVQFLYCADLEGGADPESLREPFWDFVTESNRRALQVATFRTVQHLAHGREGRLAEFIHRAEAAETLLAAWPEAESLKTGLAAISRLESGWSTALASLSRLPKTDDDDAVAERFQTALDAFFRIDRDLAAHRGRFLTDVADFPLLRGQLEAAAASVRRLQRISERIRMVENPENFPDQADLAKLRSSKAEILTLRENTDRLVDAVLAATDRIDAQLARVVDNFTPERIDPVDRAILRLATHEILNSDIPAKVAINEGIELAKRFGTSDSGRFVNGVLDRVARDARDA